MSILLWRSNSALMHADVAKHGDQNGASAIPIVGIGAAEQQVTLAPPVEGDNANEGDGFVGLASTRHPHDVANWDDPVHDAFPRLQPNGANLNTNPGRAAPHRPHCLAPVNSQSPYETIQLAKSTQKDLP